MIYTLLQYIVPYPCPPCPEQMAVVWYCFLRFKFMYLELPKSQDEEAKFLAKSTAQLSSCHLHVRWTWRPMLPIERFIIAFGVMLRWRGSTQPSKPTVPTSPRLDLNWFARTIEGIGARYNRKLNLLGLCLLTGLRKLKATKICKIGWQSRPFVQELNHYWHNLKKKQNIDKGNLKSKKKKNLRTLEEFYA